MWCNPSTGEERQANLCETEPSLVYVVSYRPAGATEKLCLKKKQEKRKGKGKGRKKKSNYLHRFFSTPLQKVDPARLPPECKLDFMTYL